ncbi:MAG: hypothetical protein ACI9A7_001740 [Cyclobacteriaceae bacterium]|jgi:hypothetical protein
MNDRSIVFSGLVCEIGSCLSISELVQDFIKAYYKH